MQSIEQLCHLLRKTKTSHVGAAYVGPLSSGDDGRGNG